LSRETAGHLQSAYCKGQARVVTNAHHNCFRELRYDLAKHARKDGQVNIRNARRRTNTQDDVAHSSNTSDDQRRGPTTEKEEKRQPLSNMKR
jgi:hypothetical protein